MGRLSQVSLRTKFDYLYEREINIETWAIAELYWKQILDIETEKVINVR